MSPRRIPLELSAFWVSRHAIASWTKIAQAPFGGLQHVRSQDAKLSSGNATLNTTSFFRNAPRVISLEDRLKWEVIVNASDAISVSFERLTAHLSSIHDSGYDIKVIEELKSNIFLGCWSIVDHVHAFFQVSKRFQRPEGSSLAMFTKEFSDSIYRLRNKMDHLSSHIRNMAAKKGPSDPVYGSIAFATPLRPDNTYEIVSFGLGGVQFDEEVGTIIDTHATPPVGRIGNIVFSAFGERLDVGRLVETMRSTVNRMDETARQQILPKIEDHAVKHGLDFAKLTEQTTKGTVVLRFSLKVE
jgi:hypothetical protein